MCLARPCGDENDIEIPYEILVVDHAVQRLLENEMIGLHASVHYKIVEPTVRAPGALGLCDVRDHEE